MKERKQAKRRAVYPRYVRDGEILVRIGWRRDREYLIAKLPKRCIEMVVSRALDVSDVDGNFKSDWITGLRDPQYGTISAVQIRFALAWLVSTEVIDRGEFGYAMIRKQTILKDIENRWKSVPKR